MLASEAIIVAAPLSFTGSAQRIWRPLVKVSTWMALVAIPVIALAWIVVASWYLTFGLLLVPYRLIRRGQRKEKKQALQHRELMAAMKAREK